MTRDRDRFPDFEDYLPLSMRRETELFVEHVIREDRSILDFIDGQYSFLNERLARTTASPDVIGPEFRRVDLTGTPRGGVLTQGSVLTVSSYATRTSPVLRGKWVLDNLLERAAAGAAARRAEPRRSDDRDRGVDARSSSRRIARTRPAPRAIAGWIRSASASRTSTPSAPGATMDGKFPIDASGTLPDGRTFNGPEELRTILAAEPRRLRARA